MYVEHSAKGTTWKEHKYIKKENGRYIYEPKRTESSRSDKERIANKQMQELERAKELVDKYSKEYEQAKNFYDKISNNTRMSSSSSRNNRLHDLSVRRAYENMEKAKNRKNTAQKYYDDYRKNLWNLNRDAITTIHNTRSERNRSYNSDKEKTGARFINKTLQKFLASKSTNQMQQKGFKIIDSVFRKI